MVERREALLTFRSCRQPGTTWSLEKDQIIRPPADNIARQEHRFRIVTRVASVVAAPVLPRRFDYNLDEWER